MVGQGSYNRQCVRSVRFVFFLTVNVRKTISCVECVPFPKNRSGKWMKMAYIGDSVSVSLMLHLLKRATVGNCFLDNV